VEKLGQARNGNFLSLVEVLARSLIRCVEMAHQCVVEHFVGFLIADDSSGESLTDLLLHRLEELGLCVSNCRGQGYDNGANMRRLPQRCTSQDFAARKSCIFHAMWLPQFKSGVM
jgi:hypothetical protein